MSETPTPEPTGPDRGPLPLWSPSAQTSKWSDPLVGAVLGGTYAMGWIVLCEAFGPVGATAPLLAIGALVAVMVVSIIWHEAGHAVAGSLAGMRLMYVRLGPWLIYLRRGGQRVWRPTKILAAVCAAPDPSRDERRQWLVFCAGGPAANLLAAVVLGAIAGMLDAPWRNAVFVAAGLNAWLGLINLVPMVRVVPSDGLHLVRWWRGVPKDHPAHAGMRLLGLWCSGTRADQLPREAIEQLRSGAPNEQLFGLHIEMAALLARKEWAEAAALIDRVESTRAALPPPMAKLLADSDIVLRQDLAFAEAMRDRSPAPIERLGDLRATPSTWLVPRLLALKAALAGDVDTRERWLAVNEREVADSRSAGSRAEEAVLRQAVRAVITHRLELEQAKASVPASIFA